MELQPLINTVDVGIGLIAMAVTAGAIVSPQDADVRSGHSPRPMHTQEAGADVSANSMQLFQDRGFHDDFVPVADVTQNKPGEIHKFDVNIKDRLTSLRWNLPAGVVLLLQEDADGSGERVALWGNGQIETLDPWDFGDKATGWSWYYVGGGNGNDAQVTAGMLPPPGAEPLMNGDAVTDATIQFFKDKDFKGEFVPATLLDQPASKLHELPGAMTDSLTSMKWKLPEGVVVVLYQNAAGKGQQVALWGSGEVSDIDIWDFNDKVSRWAWYYVGAKESDRTDRIQ